MRKNYCKPEIKTMVLNATIMSEAPVVESAPKSDVPPTDEPAPMF
jgi:hypothetical protein